MVIFARAGLQQMAAVGEIVYRVGGADPCVACCTGRAMAGAATDDIVDLCSAAL